MTQAAANIAFIGFGEAAQAFASGLRQDNASLAICAFDVKTNGEQAEQKYADYLRCGVEGKSTAREACGDSALIVSLVTADQAEEAALEAAQSDLQNTLYCDGNSCAPETKRRSAKAIEAAGGRYVDMAIMTPVHPKLHRSPCLLSGPHAEAAWEKMLTLNMDATVAGNAVGDASTRKMIRSVMVKGLEALTLECFLAAKRAGIEDDILASLDAGYPGFNWPNRAPYMLERVMTHGTRRAAEMREVVKTLDDLGISPHMTAGTVERQDEIGALGLDVDAIGAENLSALTEAILASMSNQKSD